MRSLLGKATYEPYNDKISSISHFKIFGSKYYILDTKDQLNKFDSNNQNDIFLGYSLNSSFYRIYDLETNCVEEFSDVVYDEVKVTKEVEIDYDEEEEIIAKPRSTPCNEDDLKKELEF